MMFAELDNNVLDIILASIGDHARELDDVARDAAALAMVGSRDTSAMSKKLWGIVADLASVMQPCPRAQAVASHCLPRTVTAATVRTLSRACAIKYDTSMEYLTLKLDQSDELVGQHCPIPRSAAYYVLHMVHRHMAFATVEMLYPGRDLIACRRTSKGVRFSDLRRAPIAPTAADAREARKQELMRLDRLFVGRDRPWFVRTEEQAAKLFKRERMAADGFPAGCCEWDAKEAAKFMEISKQLLLGGRWGTKHGPEWWKIRQLAMWNCPNGLALPYDFTADQMRDFLQRVAAYREAEASREAA